MTTRRDRNSRLIRRLNRPQPRAVKLARRLLEPFPTIYCATQRLRRPRKAVVDKRTSLLIEGYSGSANTFLVLAMQVANPEIRIASHVHSAAHVRRAVQLGVPSVVVVREPIGALTSGLGRFPLMPVGEALDAYAVFYERLVPDASRILVVSFNDVTSPHFDEVVTRVNERFGTTFASVDPNDPDIRDELFRAWERLGGRRSDIEADPGAPPDERAAAAKAAVSAELESQRHVEALARARRARQAILAAAGAAPLRPS